MKYSTSGIPCGPSERSVSHCFRTRSLLFGVICYENRIFWWNVVRPVASVPASQLGLSYHETVPVKYLRFCCSDIFSVPNRTSLVIYKRCLRSRTFRFYSSALWGKTGWSVVVAAVGIGVLFSRLQRMLPVVKMHCSGHSTMTQSSTIRTRKSMSLLQFLGWSCQMKFRDGWAGTSAVLVAPMSMQMHRAVGLSAPMP